MHRRRRGCWEAEACSTPGARCGLCRAPLQWWWVVWEDVDPSRDPIGFLSVWWAEYTRMRPRVPRSRPQSPHTTLGAITQEKATLLTELADRGHLPTPKQVIQGVLQGKLTPAGLEAMSRAQSALDVCPSPWPITRGVAQHRRPRASPVLSGGGPPGPPSTIRGDGQRRSSDSPWPFFGQSGHGRTLYTS